MKCPKCQRDNRDDAKFCDECGHPLKTPAPSSPIDFNKPHSYTPKFLADKILTTRSAMEGERKRVTVLFADVAGFTSMSEKLDPEQIHQIMDGCFKILMDEIHNHQGTINQFTGDGVMALFGAPVAIENHAQNACQAALSIQSAIKNYSKDLKSKFGFDFKMRIGLNSGPVIVGSIGDDLRMDYTAIGDTVNLASRMESMAEPGTVFVSSETNKRVSQQFIFNPLGKTDVKGKENALDVYVLIKEKIDRPRLGLERQIFSEMIGRDQELNKLELQINKAINNEGSVVNVIGEAGIGKSRLIAELRNSSVVKRVSFLEGKAISIGKSLSYHPIIHLLKTWARIKDDDSTTTAINKLEKAIQNIYPEDINEIFPFVATLMGIKLSGRYEERLKGIEGEALEKLIFKNLRDLLIRSTELSPLVVVMEDLHWADASTIELLESLFRLAEKQRIVFINVFRPNYPETSDRIIKTIKEKLLVYYVEIILQPLNEKMGETLINNMLNIKGLRHILVDQIIKRAGGNPFFLEEVVRSLVDEGAVIKTNGEFKVTEKIDNIIIPNTINDVLTARIDRLDENTRDLVKIASVIGRNFFYRILAEVASAIDGIDNRLSYLKQVELIREQQRMEELEYLFKHALAQEAAYESILSQKRKELHLKTADSIEKIFKERLHEFYGLLSYHYSSGDDFDKAEEYMLKAGEEALKTSASTEALQYYKKAMELYINKHGASVDNYKLAGMEENIASAFMNKGFYGDAVDYFDRAAARRGEKPNKKFIATIPKIIINIISILRHLYLPPTRKKNIPSASENQAMQRKMKVATVLVMVDTKRCFVENIELLKCAFEYDISSSQSYFNILVGGGLLFCVSGLSLKLSRKILDYAMNQMAGKNKDDLLYSFRCVEMMYNEQAGIWHTEINENAVIAALKIGDFPFATGQILYNGYMKIELGDFAGCEKIIHKLHQIYEEYNFEHAESDVYVLKTKLSIKQRKIFDARNYADKSLIQSSKTKWNGRVIESFGIKARAEVLCGNLDAARTTIEQAEELIWQIGKEAVYVSWYCDLLMGMLMYNLAMLENAISIKQTEDIKKLRKVTSRSVKAVLSHTNKKVASERTESFRLIGKYYWTIDKQKKALKWWDKAIKKGEELGARPDLSRTYFQIGKSLLEPGSKYKQLNGITAEKYLNKAITMFEEMDLQWDQNELDKAMAAR